MNSEQNISLLRTDLHEERLNVVFRLLVESGAESVLDLGCGQGLLLERLASESQFKSIVGVDQCGTSLWYAQQRLESLPRDRTQSVSVIVGSYSDSQLGLQGFDACAMVETIEHVDPALLSRVERAVFAIYRPKMVVMTTPNAEYNVIYGLSRGELRKPDHRFEWERDRFRRWTEGVAKRNGYLVRLGGIGDTDLRLGQPTQMAIFTRH